MTTSQRSIWDGLRSQALNTSEAKQVVDRFSGTTHESVKNARFCSSTPYRQAFVIMNPLAIVLVRCQSPLRYFYFELNQATNSLRFTELARTTTISSLPLFCNSLKSNAFIAFGSPSTFGSKAYASLHGRCYSCSNKTIEKWLGARDVAGCCNSDPFRTVYIRCAVR